MTVTSAPSWTQRFARRARSGGEGALAAILALSGRQDIISFSGGLPDPATLPTEILADIMRDLAAAGDSSAVQYAPVAGLSSTLDFVADRLLSHEGLRPGAGGLMITSGCIEAMELLGQCFLGA